MNRNREFLVGLVIIMAVAVGVFGTLWLQGTNFGRATRTVEALLESSGRSASDPPAAFQAIGYRELARHLSGEWTLQEAIDRIIIATRQYAKRQQTWFRKEPDVTWVDATKLDEIVPDIVSALLFDSKVSKG